MHKRLTETAGKIRPAHFQIASSTEPNLLPFTPICQKRTFTDPTVGTICSYVTLSPFLRCFFLVLRRMPLIPGTGFMSLLLMGGGCRMGLGARVRQTGRPAAHIRIPVIPDACVNSTETHKQTQESGQSTRGEYSY